MPTRNVVMLTIDDLRSPEDWGHFASMVKTPNLDRLAAMGTTFTHTITSNLPAATTLLGFQAYNSAGGTSSVMGIALASLYIETDY